MIVAFIDECRQAGHAVESICRVLTEQGCQVAARTYRLWKCRGQQVAARTINDAVVMDKVRDLAWTVDYLCHRATCAPPDVGRRRAKALAALS